MAGDFPDDLRYTSDDEWLRLEKGVATCGVTSFAAEQLGDVVYVQLPDVGAHFGAGDSLGEIESVKAVSDLYCPVEGEVAEVNGELDQNPGLVNEDPYGRGWMVKLRLDNPGAVDGLL